MEYLIRAKDEASLISGITEINIDYLAQIIIHIYEFICIKKVDLGRFPIDVNQTFYPLYKMIL